MCSRSTFNKAFAVAILTGINFLNYMDRYTIAGRYSTGVRMLYWLVVQDQSFIKIT